MDVTELAKNLWIGSAPNEGPGLARAGFKVLVLTAKEVQPPSFWFPRLHVIREPLDDHRPREEEILAAHRCARQVSEHVLAGDKTLVTCFAGRNRSGWVSALTLVELGLEPRAAVARVQSRRNGSLFNAAFVADILKTEGRLRRAR